MQKYVPKIVGKNRCRNMFQRLKEKTDAEICCKSFMKKQMKKYVQRL